MLSRADVTLMGQATSRKTLQAGQYDAPAQMGLDRVGHNFPPKAPQIRPKHASHAMALPAAMSAAPCLWPIK